MKRHGAFTLVELLVVVAIVVVLIAILLPSMARARAVSRRAVCLTHLRGLNQALAMYVAQYNSLIPAGTVPSINLLASDKWSLGLQLSGNDKKVVDKLSLCPETALPGDA